MLFTFADNRDLALRGPEHAQLEAWLDFQRDSLLVKCSGLDEIQLAERPVMGSLLSLLGLVRHLIHVEQYWFSYCYAGLDVSPHFKSFTRHSDDDFTELESMSASDVFALFHVTVQQSRNVATNADLDSLAQRRRKDDDVDLRWIYVHLIEEYARHLGHADILRELIDGETGY
ncbi:MAG TPA: DinB family protein [Acidimicrobiales bacterium]|nr:MAG: hypothetical protein B7X07_00560 [Actinobacteria bacterium 21-64-8]HQU00756.1 DinB family protein [Acidimicrobiales bacterium]